MRIFKSPDFFVAIATLLAHAVASSTGAVLLQFKAVNTRLHSGISTVLNFLQFLAIKLPGMFDFGIQRHPLTPQ